MIVLQSLSHAYGMPAPFAQGGLFVGAVREPLFFVLCGGSPLHRAELQYWHIPKEKTEKFLKKLLT